MSYEIVDPGFKNGRRIIPDRFGSYDVLIKQDGQIVKTIHVSPVIYSAVLIGYITLSVLIICTAIVLGDITSTFSWGGAVIATLLLHFAFSFTYVKQSEVAGLLFYGRPVQEVNSGLLFAPIGIIEVVRLPRKPIQAQFPGDPEKVYKGTDEDYFKLTEEERKKYVLPIRATSGSPTGNDDGSESNILNTQMTLEVNFYVRWQIEHFWVYVIRIENLEEANRQLRDSGERVIIEEIAKRTPAKVVAEIMPINEELRAKLESITQDWGIYIVETAMLSPDLTYKVNDAIRNNVVKKAEATQTIVTAQAEKKKLELEGQGKAYAKQAELEAMAKGAKALGLSGSEIVDLEKARALAGGNTTIFVDGGGQGGVGGLLGIGARLAAGGSEALKPKEERNK